MNFFLFITKKKKIHKKNNFVIPLTTTFCILSIIKKHTFFFQRVVGVQRKYICMKKTNIQTTNTIIDKIKTKNRINHHGCR